MNSWVWMKRWKKMMRAFNDVGDVGELDDYVLRAGDIHDGEN